MPKPHHDRSRGSKNDRRDEEGDEREPYDDPEEHLEIERERFAGGLPPTPELYARAREQWNRLPGSLVRPSMDPVIRRDDGKPTEPTPSRPEQKRSE